MRRLFPVLVLLVFAPALAFAQSQPPQTPPKPKPITCAELPKAEAYVDTKLKPGHNTDLAKKHLAAAKNAKSDAQCAAELKKVDYYARRSLAADKKAAPPKPAS
jgi:hypothetical protein